MYVVEKLWILDMLNVLEGFGNIFKGIWEQVSLLKIGYFYSEDFSI